MHFRAKITLKNNRYHNAKQTVTSALGPILTLRACLKLWLRLFFKVFLTLKYIKIIFIIFYKIYFLTLTHQN
jgi:hypothetical protein